MTRLVVELAGPAGAGKTTLARALERDRGAGLVPAPPRGQLVRGITATAPSLAAARLSRPGRWWTREELRSLAYLTAWQEPVRRAGTDLLFDHGPAFRLTRLAAGGPPMATSPVFRRFWDELAHQWAALLTVVVWLDAPDEVLVARIEARPRAHQVRRADEPQARAFLEGYRRACAETLQLLAGQGVRVERFDSSTCPPEELARSVAAALGTPVS